MLSELERKRVWQAWFEGEVRANYFADLSTRYRWRQRMASWTTLFVSSGAFVALLAKLQAGYGWVPAVLTLFAAGVSLYSVVVQNQQSTVDSANLHEGWNRLAKEYRALWNATDAAEAGPRLATLDATAVELSKSGTALPYRKGLIRKWHGHVVEEFKAAGLAA